VPSGVLADRSRCLNCTVNPMRLRAAVTSRSGLSARLSQPALSARGLRRPSESVALRPADSQSPRCSADLCHSVASQLPNTLDDSVCDARQGDQVRSQFEWAVPRSAQVSTQNVCETGMMRRSASGTVGRPRLSRSGCHRHAQRSAGYSD